MKTITLVACSRLDYLKSTVESLKNNNLAGYTLFIGVEPLNAEVISYCRQLNFMPTELTVNSSQLGVAGNPLATITRAFESGSEFNVALEDDLLLSPDALDLANWFLELPQNPDYFCLNLFHYGSNPELPSEIVESNHFAPLGWAATAKMWRDFIQPSWLSDRRGWDFSVNQVLLKEQKLKLLRPNLARANHLGREGGVHCSPEFHDQVFSKLVISDGSIRKYSLFARTRHVCNSANSKISPKITVVVVANHHRRALITESLGDVPHTLHMTTDYNLPEGFVPVPEYMGLSPNQTGPYRCFRGHQDALKTVGTPFALVLEDDAVPNRNDWVEIANKAADLLGDYELISLHSREVDCTRFNSLPFSADLNFLVPKTQGDAWVLGSLAYLVNMSVANRLVEAEFDGFPTDLFICRKFKFGVVAPSPFDHDRSQGSLVESLRD